MNNTGNELNERFIQLGSDVKWGINGQQKSNEEISFELKEKRKKLQEEAFNKYMIIGSVVGIEGNFEQLMIIGYKAKDSFGEENDYVACKYPNGVTEPLIYFNHEDIKRVYFVGFTTDYGQNYKSNLDNEDKKKGMMM